MTTAAEPERPVPRWLHAWSVLVVVATFALLAIGQLVTSFGAGMADRVWPTEPWYVFRTATETEKERFRAELGFFIEHTHRIAGFTVGGLVTVLAVGLWWTEPRRAARWVGLAGLVVLIAGFGDFHRGLMAQRDVAPRDVKLPAAATAVTLAGLAVALGAALAGAAAGVRGGGLRLLGILALIGVMIQGLLGGFRVKLNELFGTDLAATHGVFAQVVFGLLVTLAVLTARGPTRETPSRALRWWGAALAALLFVQVVWGAMVRHQPTPLAQRLHFLTAFLATAAAVWVLRAVFADAAARARAGFGGWLLAALLVAQLYLGVEAWLEKFGTYTLPELVPITKENAAIRTLHALVGSALLATAVGVAVRLNLTAGHEPANEAGDEWAGPAVIAGRVEDGVAVRFRGDAP